MTYAYRHTNGQIITKPDFVVDAGGGPHAYFDSPFCEEWWHVETREDERKGPVAGSVPALD